MKCPNCWKDNNHVIECRTRQKTKDFYRRRECYSCGFRFTTREQYCPDEFDTPDRHPRRLEKWYEE